MSKAVTISNNVNPPAIPGTYFRLLCLTGKKKGVSYYLNSNRVVMGRSEDVDVTIYDQKSSRQHCELVKHGGTYVLTDLGSQNGVMINDLKVTQHTLNEGDKIIIGKTVYKFNKIEVAPPEEVDEEEEDEDDEYEEDEEDEEGDEEKAEKNNSTKSGKKGKQQDPAQKRKRLIIVGVVLTLGILLIDTGEQSKSQGSSAQDNPGRANDPSDLSQNTVSTTEHENPEIQKQIETHIHRGLREYREKNYFRAINEFNLALILSPNHGSASYYLRKTKQSLDEDIEQFFLKARQEFDALKFREALSSYCSIIRLLQKKPQDQRYKDAMKNIKILEKKIGLDPGEANCLEK